MANFVKPTILLNGPRTAVIHYTIQGDGAASELASEVILEPNDVIDKDGTISQRTFTITQLWWSFVGFDALLGFDAGTPEYALVMGQSGPQYFDFRSFGGLKDRSGTDATGKMTLTTQGLANSASKGTLIIEVRKT